MVFPYDAAMIRQRRASFRAVAAALAIVAVSLAQAQGFGVATWNVHWLMDAATHARWTAACARLAWPVDAGALPPSDRATLAGLPFCDVHNGMAFPAEACESDRDGWPRAARYPDDHPCRETMDLAEPSRHARKHAALRAMWQRLDAMGVRLVALQEVFDASAVRAVMPPQWSVATTNELAGAPRIPQHVGVAWRRGLDVRAFELVGSLADSGDPARPLRPGLAFTVDVGERPVRVLVVHLKAGCRSRDLDTPLTSRDAALAAPRREAIASDCALLRYQLPALEAWIDANAARDFAVMGDFNRTLLREPVADSANYRTRQDGSAASDPLGRCVIERDGERAAVRCDVRTRAMFPELNDGEPPGAVLWRARFADMGRGGTIPKGSSGDCRVDGARGELTHDGIDHIVIAESLMRRLTPAALTMHAVNYRDDAGEPLRGGYHVALPSDHCPHVVRWIPRRGNDP
jgi:endonuclease/exonuclease/phosphatase family metal-dependent hydrolase